MDAPLHLQLRKRLRDRIVRGKDAPGDLLPTEEVLMSRYGISRTVVRQAMQSLASEGLIVRIAGKGTFVAVRPSPPRQHWSVGTLDELLAYGLDTRLDVLSRRTLPARAAVAALLGLATGARVFEIRGLRSSRDGLFSYQSNYFLPDVGAALRNADLSRGSLLEALQDRVSLHITHAQQSVTAVAADAETARLLDLAPGSPVLVIQRVFFSAERGPVEVGLMRYRPDRFRYESRLTRATPADAQADAFGHPPPSAGRRLTLVKPAAAPREQPTRLQRRDR